MGKFLRLVNGIPRHQDEASSVAIYDQTYIVSGTITTGTPITLPMSGTYTDNDLEVFWNGQAVSVGADYSYIGSPPRTQISMTFNLSNGDELRFRTDTSSSSTIYDDYISIGSTITAGTEITLPNSGTYQSDELEVYLNGQRLHLVIDYSYVGGPPRNKIILTFDLYSGDTLRFRTEVV